MTIAASSGCIGVDVRHYGKTLFSVQNIFQDVSIEIDVILDTYERSS